MRVNFIKFLFFLVVCCGQITSAQGQDAQQVEVVNRPAVRIIDEPTVKVTENIPFERGIQNLKNYIAEVILNNRSLGAMPAPSVELSSFIPSQVRRADFISPYIMRQLFPFYIVETDRNIYSNRPDRPFGINVAKLDDQHPFKRLYSLDSLNIHRQFFCSEQQEKKGFCKVKNGFEPNADLTATSIFNKDVLLTQKEQLAGFSYFRQLFPYLFVKLPIQMKEEGKIMPEAISKIKVQWGGIARQTLAQHVFEDLIEQRIPINIYQPNPKDFNGARTVDDQRRYGLAAKQYNALKSYYNLKEESLDLLPTEVTRKVAGFDLNLKAKGIKISPRQLSKYQVEARYNNPDWQLRVANASNNALMREMVLMKAFELKLLYENNQKLDEMRALLTLLSSAAANSEAMADLMKRNLQRSATVAGSGTSNN